MTDITQFRLPIFQTKNLIVFYDDADEVAEALQGQEGGIFDEEELEFVISLFGDEPGLTLTFDGINVVAAFFNISRMDEGGHSDLFSHEAIHCACGVIRGVGMELNEQTEETLAYLHQYYVEKFNELYKELI